MFDTELPKYKASMLKIVQNTKLHFWWMIFVSWVNVKIVGDNIASSIIQYKSILFTFLLYLCLPPAQGAAV